MDIQIRATITRNSNGSVDLRPIAGEPNPFNIDRLTIHTAGTPSAKDFPVDSEATVSISSGVRGGRIDGKPDVVGEDGLVHGDILPDVGERIGAAVPGAPNVTGTAKPLADRRKK